MARGRGGEGQKELLCRRALESGAGPYLNEAELRGSEPVVISVPVIKERSPTRTVATFHDGSQLSGW